MYSLDCMTGVIRVLVFPVCRYDEKCKVEGQDSLEMMQTHRSM